MTPPQACHRRFALLDRDGTIILDKCYLGDADAITFAPGALAGMQLLRDAGFGLVLITNQSGVARGYIDQNALDSVHRKLGEMLAGEGLHLEAIYFCPHGPDDGCSCRKPRPGMLHKAMADLGFAPAQAVMIGDSLADMDAAAAAGVPGIRITPPDASKTAEACPDFLTAAQRAIALFC